VIGRHRRAGDGFIACACGRRHWGRFGAAGLLVRRGGDVLLQHRAAWSHEGGTWAVPGGALDLDESALAGALREAAEEAAVPAESVQPRHAWTVDHGTWAYTTVVAEAVGPIVPRRLDGESEELRWVSVDEVTSLRLHSGFAAGWARVASLLDRHEVVVMDAANVVGSTPDGWWRDRAGAAARLLSSVETWSSEGLAQAGESSGHGSPSSPLVEPVAGRTRAWPDWVVVLEGQATGAVSQPGSSVAVVRAQGSGDDTIVDVAQRQVARGGHVTVVTADRALQARVESVGARHVGPRALPPR
jgi:8-oxo-dGTP diphosphatase